MRRESTRSLDQKYVNWREQRIVQQILTEAGLAGSKVLDAPCGYGRFWPTFRRLGISPTGIELDEGPMGLGGLNKSDDGAAVRADIFHLPFAGGAFDCVFSVRFLHLNFSDSERLRILRELARVSRQFLLLSIYRPTGLHGVARLRNSTPGRVRMMTDTQLNELEQAASLERLTTRPLQRFFHMQTFVLMRKKAQ